MELEIIKEKETPLLSRRRITVNLLQEGPTPSRIELIKALSKKLGIAEDLISIRHIYTSFGKKNAKLIVHVYKDAEDLIRLEGAKLAAKHKRQEKTE